jgi:hypothetical protein
MCGSAGATATVNGRLPIDLLNCAAVAAGAAGLPIPVLTVRVGDQVQVSGGLVTATSVELVARPEGSATISRLPDKGGWLIVLTKPGTISVIAADIYICGGATPCALLQVDATNG